MAPIKSLLAFASFAILSVNALSVEGHHVNRNSHNAIAKAKRDDPASSTGRCKPRPSSSVVALPSSTPVSLPSSAPAPHSSSSAVVPHSSSAAPPAQSSPASGGNGGSGKLGLCWANGNDPRLKLLATPRTNFIYTWSPEIPSDAKTLGLTPVPQLWGWNQVDSFKKTVVKGYATHVLGMNEPNEPGQSNMDPGSGAQLWMQYIQPLKAEGYSLGTPATSSNPNGLVWVKDFMAACKGCSYDFVTLHWYDTTFDKFKTYVELWHNTFGKNIWVTEFACQNFNGGGQPSISDVWNFYGSAIPWLDSQDYVEMYAPFGYMDDLQGVNENDALFSGNSLSSLGWFILNGN